MHYHAEIIIPPTNDVEGAIAKIMAPFSENDSAEDCMERHSFWDWYVIGGRYSGRKLTDSLDKNKLESFQQWLTAEKVTISGLIWGKQEINPPSQIEKIDKKWNEMFPSPDGELYPCPIFQHGGKQHSSDIWPLSRSRNCEAFRVIIAAPTFNDLKEGTWDGPLEANFMVSKEVWNGVTHQDTAWDGKIATAVDAHIERLKNCNEKYLRVAMPTDDWLVVTVDYHT